jgi:uncharacterized protein (TIGR04255 family)
VAQIRHLPNAPIKEALIDLRVERPDSATVDALIAEIGQRDNLGYLKDGTMFRSAFGFSVVGQEGRATADATTIGVKLKSPDGSYIAQMSIEGFTLSRVQQYQDWDTLLHEAQRLWDVYTQCLGASPRITRYATRYINNLRLPSRTNLERFLLLLPRLPHGLPDKLSSFLQRFVLHDDPSNATAIVTVALEGTPPDGPLPLVLDIDAFRVASFSGSDPEVWPHLSQLRRLKNEIFFACLTEEAVALYL